MSMQDLKNMLTILGIMWEYEAETDVLFFVKEDICFVALGDFSGGILRVGYEHENEPGELS